MQAQIKGSFLVLGQLFSTDELLKFIVPVEDKKDISLKFTPEQKNITACQEVDISKTLFELSLNEDELKDSPKEKEELIEIQCSLKEATTRLIEIIKYNFWSVNIAEELIHRGRFYIFSEETQWRETPNLLPGGSSEAWLNPNISLLKEGIQNFLYSDFEPFVAMKHLHRAIKERHPRFKWIDATIAAELAIKEFFVKLKPELSTYLMEVPAPPLDKLYGSVLENFTGERSPKLREIKKGIEIRNKLIHRPLETNITREQAFKYVKDIQIAIIHLHSVLYSGDPVLDRYK